MRRHFLAANRRFDGFFTAKSIADIYYLTHRATHSHSEARNILSSLFKLFELLDTMGLDCRKALTSPLSDFEGAIMSESTLRASVDYIVTRNERDYRQSSRKAAGGAYFRRKPVTCSAQAKGSPKASAFGLPLAFFLLCRVTPAQGC